MRGRINALWEGLRVYGPASVVVSQESLLGYNPIAGSSIALPESYS